MKIAYEHCLALPLPALRRDIKGFCFSEPSPDKAEKLFEFEVKTYADGTSALIGLRIIGVVRP